MPWMDVFWMVGSSECRWHDMEGHHPHIVGTVVVAGGRDHAPGADPAQGAALAHDHATLAQDPVAVHTLDLAHAPDHVLTARVHVANHAHAANLRVTAGASLDQDLSE